MDSGNSKHEGLSVDKRLGSGCDNYCNHIIRELIMTGPWGYGMIEVLGNGSDDQSYNPKTRLPAGGY